MKVRSKEVKKYSVVRWYDFNSNATTYGIRVTMIDNKKYFVSNDKGPMFFNLESEAKNECYLLNKQNDNTTTT